MAETSPRETVVVMISDSEIKLQGEPVVRVDQARGIKGSDISVLRKRLAAEARQRLPNANKAGVLEVTIMGDKAIPYELLKRVMLSCTRAGFSKISLSVLQKADQLS